MKVLLVCNEAIKVIRKNINNEKRYIREMKDFIKDKKGKIKNKNNEIKYMIYGRDSESKLNEHINYIEKK